VKLSAISYQLPPSAAGRGWFVYQQPELVLQDAHVLACFDVPHSCGPVVRGREDLALVGAPLDVADGVRVAGELAKTF
jgi:hypothetical protein